MEKEEESIKILISKMKEEKVLFEKKMMKEK